MSDINFYEKNEGDCDDERTGIREDLKQMSFEDLMKLKEELGSKVYNEAVFGASGMKKKIIKDNYKRENKNRPREMSSKRQVPLISLEAQTKDKTATGIRDPRFDSKCGNYNSQTFRQNYEFISEIRNNEIGELKQKLRQCSDDHERTNLKLLIQRFENKNIEERKLKKKDLLLKQEHELIKKAKEEGKQPYYPKKREMRAKELVQQFVELKETGKLQQHIVKRRKKNATKDRKKLDFD